MSNKIIRMGDRRICPPLKRGTTGGLKETNVIAFIFYIKGIPLFPPDWSGQAIEKKGDTC